MLLPRIRPRTCLKLSCRSVSHAVDRKQAATTLVNEGIHNQGSIWAGDEHLPPLIYHPRPYGIPVALLHFRSHHIKLLELFTHFASHTGSALGIPISKPTYLPTKRSLWTVIRGPFVHKKSQENFERLVHKRCIKAWDADPVVIGIWERYLQEHQVPGVGLRFIRWERASLDYMGSADVAAYRKGRDHERQISNYRKKQIAAIGEGLVESQLQAAASEAASEYYKQRLLSDMQSTGLARAASTEEGILDKLPEKIRQREQGKSFFAGSEDPALEDPDLKNLNEAALQKRNHWQAFRGLTDNESQQANEPIERRKGKDNEETSDITGESAHQSSVGSDKS